MTHHDEPGDEGRVSDVPETAVVDVRLHLQVEEEAFVDDVGKPARRAAEERGKKNSPRVETNRAWRRHHVNEQLISDLQFITRATEEPSDVNQLPLMKPAEAFRGHVCRRIIRLFLNLLFRKWLGKNLKKKTTS